MCAPKLGPRDSGNRGGAVKAGRRPPVGGSLDGPGELFFTSWNAKPVRASWSSPVLPGSGTRCGFNLR
jgi:hypothetical protein